MPKARPKAAKSAAHRTLDEKQLLAVAGLLEVLSESSRLCILQALKAGPASVSQIIEMTGLKQANASKQLGILQNAGVVNRRQEGNRAIYSIAMGLVFDLCELVCSGMAQQAAEYARELGGGGDR